jgi:sulfite oxidase
MPGPAEPPRGHRESAIVRADHIAADNEQTLADSDQTLSDTDQTSSDSDQTSADSDQWAADRDQAASDRDLAAGVDAEAHEFSRDIRRRSARRREQGARARLDAADARDQIAESRDLGALARDQAATARDRALAQRDAAYQRDDGALEVSGAETVIRAAGHRHRAARQRAQAAEQRELAAQDRQGAARDRDQAASERRQAHGDREALARQLASSETDPLTGARTLAAGLTDLEHELARCHSTGGALVVANVDVVALETLDAGEPRAAGDELLKGVVALMKQHLRPFDLIIRLGDDEFLCAMANMSLRATREHFSAVAAELAAPPWAGAIRIGFAELAPGESVTELIARAAAQLAASRRGTEDL